MYQFSLAIGKSTGYEVTVANVAATTILPQGTVGIMIGETTGKPYALLEHFVNDAVDGLVQALRHRGQLLTDQASYLLDPADGFAQFSTTSSAGDATAVVAGINAASTGAKAVSSALVENALKQCCEYAREYIGSHLATGIKP
jgi:hypothetical protein